MDILEVDGHIEIADPASIRPKKITGTRLASVLGLNRWNTPFQTWCEITKAYSKPFEDTIYTLAGKAIEPKQLQYLKNEYFFEVETPTDVFGEDYFSRTHGDFFGDTEVFGGMWDGLVGGDSVEGRVIECKTTKRAEDWLGKDGELDPPEYYRVQAFLYAYLVGCKNVTMIVSFLEDADYDNPEDYTVSDENTAVVSYVMDFDKFEKEYIEPARNWWKKHIETGVSPTFDEVADKEYLKPLRTKTAAKADEIDALLKELKDCHATVAKYHAKCAEQESRESEIKKQLKKYAEQNIGDKEFWEYDGDAVKCKLSTSYREKVDTAQMRDDGVLDKYISYVPSTRFTVSFE